MSARILRRSAAALFLVTGVAAAGAPKTQVQVTWLGHACFLVVSPGGTQLLIDPWIKGNPATPDSLQDLSRYKPNAILVSHSHFDHSKDAKEIALASGASVVGTYDWVGAQGLPEKQVLGGNVGRNGEGWGRRDPPGAGGARQRAGRTAHGLCARVCRRPDAVPHR